MRVHERGVGETESCGTGACAAAVATAVWGGSAREPDGSGGGDSPDLPASYTVDVLGGRLTVTWDTNKHVHLKGPAVLVAHGSWHG
jgi:diaminopimelate epimerase